MKHKNHQLATPSRSIFVDLLFVLLAAMVMIHVFIGGVFALLTRPRSEKIISENLKHYAEEIVRDLGVPPDTLKARQIADRYQLTVWYEGGDFKWSNDPTFSHRNRVRLFKCGPSTLWRKPVVIENADGSRFTLAWRLGPTVGMHREVFITLAAAVTLIILGANVLIRRLLRPIHWLHEGVKTVETGNTDVSIPVQRNDELGRLTEAFNSMTRRIKDMLKARDQLLLDVSHELRSPLTRIKVALEFVKDSPKKDSILSDIAEIEAMITEILETERLKNGHGQLTCVETDVTALIRDASKQFQDKHPGVKISSVPGKLVLWCDPERIRLVLKNVLDNAVKFSLPDSTPITITTDQTETSVIIRVRDDGTGIPEDRIAYVFEPFYRADPSRSRTSGGYGLGLHLCRKIMEAHRGKIQINNNTNARGVTVRLEFVESSRPSDGIHTVG